MKAPRIVSGKSKSNQPKNATNSPTDRAQRVQKLSTRCSILAGIAAVSLIIAAYALISSSATMRSMTTSSQNVIVASQNIPSGQALTEENTKIVSVPADYRASNAILETDKSNAIGHNATTDIAQGAQITTSNIDVSTTPVSLSDAIDKDYVAASISVDATSGVSNLLCIGNKVKVYRSEGGDGGVSPSALLFSESVKVLALDKNLTTPTDTSTTYTNVVVQVTPNQAALISSAQGGKASSALYLALEPSTSNNQ